MKNRTTYILQHAFLVSYSEMNCLDQKQDGKIVVVNTFKDSVGEAEKRFRDSRNDPASIISVTYLGECVNVPEYVPTGEEYERPEPTVDQMANSMREAILTRSNDERMEILSAIDICRYCGADTEFGACHCMNDE